MRPSVRPAVDERLDPHRALSNGLPGVSNTFTGTLPAGLSRLTKLIAVCVSRPAPLCIPTGSPCRLARGLAVSGRQASLRCRPTRQLSRLVLRPSSVDSLVRSRPLSVRLHSTAWDVLGSASHTNKPWFIQAMEAAERPQPRVRIGATFGYFESAITGTSGRTRSAARSLRLSPPSPT